MEGCRSDGYVAVPLRRCPVSRMQRSSLEWLSTQGSRMRLDAVGCPERTAGCGSRVGYIRLVVNLTLAQREGGHSERSCLAHNCGARTLQPPAGVWIFTKAYLYLGRWFSQLQCRSYKAEYPALSPSHHSTRLFRIVLMHSTTRIDPYLRPCPNVHASGGAS